MGKSTNALLTAKINNQIAKVLYSPVHLRAENQAIPEAKRVLSGYLGASEVNIIINQRNRSAFNLAQEKVGIIERKEVDNIYTRYGQAMEPIIINDVEKLGYQFMTEKKRCHVYKLSGVVDGIDHRQQIILEVKTFTHQPDMESYINQIHVYFHIWGYDKAMLALYQRNDIFDANNTELYNITRDSVRLSMILDKVSEFWRKCEILKTDRQMKKKQFDALEV